MATANNSQTIIVVSVKYPFSLKNGEVDVSKVIPYLKLYKYSSRVNYHTLQETKEYFLKRQIPHWCGYLLQDMDHCKAKVMAKLNPVFEEAEASEKLIPSYTQIGTLEKNYVSTALKNFDKQKNCQDSATCSGSDIKNIVRYGSTEDFQKLYSRIQNKGDLCHQALLTRLSASLYEEKTPRVCLENLNQNPLCQEYSSVAKMLSERILKIKSLVYLKKSKNLLCLPCLLPQVKENSVESIRDLTHLFLDEAQCRDLKPGDRKQIVSGAQGEGYIPRTYHVEKEEDGSYSIPLFLNFQADFDYDGPVSSPEVSSFYLKKARACLNKASQKMKGPDGKALRIKIKPPPSQNEVCKPLGTHTIAVGSKHHRDNSKKYSSEADCSTITHEVLHLLGLPDEYEEHHRGFHVHSETGEVLHSHSEVSVFKKAYDCRIVKEEDNIMSSNVTRWNSVFKEGKEESLLNPEHFNAIVYGSCSRNRLFNECARLSQMSSVEDPDCLEQKFACEQKLKSKL